MLVTFIYRHNMASGRNARGDEIDKLHLATNAVYGIDEIDAGERLADHRAFCVCRFLFHVNMDFCISHFQRVVDQIQKRIIEYYHTFFFMYPS